MNNAQKQNIAQVYLLNLAFTFFALVFSCICYFLRDMFRDPIQILSAVVLFSSISASILLVNKLVRFKNHNSFALNVFICRRVYFQRRLFS